MPRQKIIDKICKCLRLSESCNPNEAASALRQARRLMKKYQVSEEQIEAADVAEAASQNGIAYTPPFWALALADIVAKAFECQVLVARQYGRQPEYRFIGMLSSPELAMYTFTVLYRKLEQAREEFMAGLGDLQSDVHERERGRRGDVFAQAWLFRVARKVAEFSTNPVAKAAVDAYIQEHYGETLEMSPAPAMTEGGDYTDILSGMREADGVNLYHSMILSLRPSLLVNIPA